ncbi:unnamed protein product [Amoebophrya sp. A25]|nr:unnamed protein product [Amoebophrya sp. A25]|eukprot:GSA25T00018010001.1
MLSRALPRHWPERHVVSSFFRSRGRKTKTFLVLEQRKSHFSTSGGASTSASAAHAGVTTAAGCATSTSCTSSTSSSSTSSSYSSSSSSTSLSTSSSSACSSASSSSGAPLPITASTYASVRQDVLEAIEECEFVAFDMELTGLHRMTTSRFVGVQQAYDAHAQGAKYFMPVQMGLCMGRRRTTATSSSTGVAKNSGDHSTAKNSGDHLHDGPKTTGSAANDTTTTNSSTTTKTTWELCPVSIYLFPSHEERNVLLSTATVKFLASNGFSFDTWVREGCAWLRPGEEEHEKSAIRARIEEIEQLRKAQMRHWQSGGSDGTSRGGATTSGNYTGRGASAGSSTTPVHVPEGPDKEIVEKVLASIRTWLEETSSQSGERSSNNHVVDKSKTEADAAATRGGIEQGDNSASSTSSTTSTSTSTTSTPPTSTPSTTTSIDGQTCTQDSLQIPMENAFQRLLLHTLIAQEFPFLYSQSTRTEHGRFLSIFKNQKDVYEGQLKHLAKEISLVEARRGVRELLDAISKSGKLLVGHNCFYDVCHLFQTFYADLPDNTNTSSGNGITHGNTARIAEDNSAERTPEAAAVFGSGLQAENLPPALVTAAGGGTVAEFKRQWLQRFKKTVDTKYMSDAHDLLSVLSPPSSLRDLCDFMVSSCISKEMQLDVRSLTGGRYGFPYHFQKYLARDSTSCTTTTTTSSSRSTTARLGEFSHDAGYDSLLTALTFLFQAQHILEKKSLRWSEVPHIESLFQLSLNKIRLVKTTPNVIDLSSPSGDTAEGQASAARRHFYMCGYQKGWQRWEILRVWSPVTVSISAVSDTACWIICRTDEDAENLEMIWHIIQQNQKENTKTPKFMLYSYDEYRREVASKGRLGGQVL